MNRGVMAAVAVFGVLLVAVLATREKNVSVGIKKLELPAVDKDKVTAFEVTGAKTATLRKEGAAWFVTDPANPAKKFAVDENAINAALDALAELAKPGDYVGDKADKHAEMEVDEAKGLRVKISAGGAPVDLIFGKNAKGGGGYIRRPTDAATFTSKARLGMLMKKDVSGWRKRTLLTAKADEFKEITAAFAGGTSLTLQSEDGKAWKLKDGTVTPEGYRFDATAAGRLAQSVASLRAQEFLDVAPTGGDAALGLAGDHDVITATLKDGKTITVELGTEFDSRIQGAVNTIKTNFDAVDVAGTKDGRLSLAELQTAAADKARADDVRKALELAAQPAVFAALDTGAWGFKAKDDAIAQEDLDSAQKTLGMVPVRVGGDAQVYLVPQYSVTQVRKKLADYRDLGLLAFDPEQVRKITVNAAKKTVVVKQGAEWKVTEPKELPPGFEFDGGQVMSQLSMLKALKAGRLIEPAVPDAQSGLNKPTATVELELEDKTVVALRFGKETTNDKGAKEFFVRGNADKALYALGEFQKKRFETGVELFRKPKPPPNFGQGGGMGGMQGLENLPPDVRKKLEQQLRGMNVN